MGILLAVCITRYAQNSSHNLCEHQAIKDVSASYDALVELFELIESFLRRLDIYTRVQSTTAMTLIVVKILVELLATLALATQQVKQGRLSESFVVGVLLSLSRESVKFGKKILGENDVEVLLQKLDRLTQEESQTAATLTLEVVHDFAKNLKVVMECELYSFYSFSIMGLTLLPR
jgi:hypothetical protein